MVYRLPTGLTSGQLATLSFEDGLDANSNLVAVDFWNWTPNSNPATYPTPPFGTAHKWEAPGQAPTPGTSGGTITYYFDSGSNWTAAEQQAFISGLTLWSDYANVSFQQAASAAQAQVVFYRYGSTTVPAGITLSAGTYYNTPYAIGTVGTTTIGQNTSGPSNQAYLVIDTANVFTSQLGSFSTFGADGVSALVHEEGELLGLGHTGPYGTTPPTQQLNQYDTELYSINSFYSPADSTAPYYNSYGVVGTNWGSTSDGHARGPTTPQMLDIVAIQQLYGVSTSSTFAGGQVFGFNTNITDASRPFFDFTVDTVPVITLWDSGTDNTLDLSGYSTNSTVNLNSGSFSSVAGLVNNLGIAVGTAIDTAIGGSGNDSFSVNGDADTINGGGGFNTVIFSSSNYANFQFTVSGGPVLVTNTSTGVTDALTNIQNLQFADQSVLVSSLACFAEGTLIAGEHGARAVEKLCIGERVHTRGGAMKEVVWLGHRRVDMRRHPQPHQVMPICVQADAFGEGLPRRDLWLSPDHALFFGADGTEGVLIPVRCLENGHTIARQSVAAITYWHVELAEHDVLLAEGLPAESYLETGNRACFGNGGTVVRLVPDFAGQAWEAAGCAPLVVCGPVVDAVREGLAARAYRSVRRSSIRRLRA